MPWVCMSHADGAGPVDSGRDDDAIHLGACFKLSRVRSGKSSCPRRIGAVDRQGCTAPVCTRIEVDTERQARASFKHVDAVFFVFAERHSGWKPDLAETDHWNFSVHALCWLMTLWRCFVSAKLGWVLPPGRIGSHSRKSAPASIPCCRRRTVFCEGG
jgi:hypothetical protein